MKYLLTKALLGLLAFILLLRFVDLGINIGIGKDSECREGTHCYYAGKVSLTDKTIASLTTAGDATLNNVTIQGRALIAGNLVATKGSFASLKAAGRTTLEDITITESTVLSGSLTATNSHFGAISAHQGSHLELVRSTTSSITITKASAFFSTTTDNLPQILLDASTVEGNIEFKENEGTVVLKNGGQVKGKVIGGKVITDNIP